MKQVKIQKWTVVVVLFLITRTMLLAQSPIFLTELSTGSLTESKSLHFQDGLMYLSDFNSPHPMRISSSLVTDESGKVIIYSNGCFIYDADHEPLHSNSLQVGNYIDQWCESDGGILPMSHVFLRKPSVENEYLYIYNTSGANGQASMEIKDLRILTVNITSKWISDHEIILPFSVLSGFDITAHGNGNDYWLTVADLNTSMIKVFLIENDSYSLAYEAPMALSGLLPTCKHETNIQFSPDNRKILVHVSGCYLAVFDFDNCSGEVAGPRMNLNTFSYNPGAQASFSSDGLNIVIHRDFFFEAAPNSGQSEIQIFNTNKIGVTSMFDLNLYIPANFSMGRIIQNENNLLIFNRFGDRKYLKLQIDSSDPVSGQIDFVRLPYWYSSGFSRTQKFNSGIDNCTTSSTAITMTADLKIYPNPAFDKIFFSIQEELNVENQFPYKVTITDIVGKIKSQFFIFENNTPIDVSRLIPGHYVLIIVDKAKNQLVKTVVIK